MLNSILLLGSCYNKNKKVSALFTAGLMLNLFIVQYGYVKIEFLIANALIMLAVSIINKKITNNTIKAISSIFSILVWSICIDTVCYYMFPLFNSNLNIIGYVINGIEFNFKYVVYNSLFLGALNSIEILIKYLNTLSVKNKVLLNKTIEG